MSVIDKTTVAEIRRAFKKNPELSHMAPYVAGGLKIINFAFDSLSEAQKIKAPRGVEVGEIMIRVKNPNNSRAAWEITTADWIMNEVMKAVGYEKEKDTV